MKENMYSETSNYMNNGRNFCYMNKERFYEVKKMFYSDIEVFWHLKPSERESFRNQLNQWTKENCSGYHKARKNMKEKRFSDCVHNNEHPNDLGSAYEVNPLK